MTSSDLSKILITGANGFIGKNLTIRLNELSNYEILTFLKEDSHSDLSDKILKADIIVHLAGVNRPLDSEMFSSVNSGLTKKISEILISNKHKIPIIFSSSTQINLDNDYGRSKLEAESILKELSQKNGNSVSIFRLPGVYGKWCKPNYNSVVATFCHNIANEIPIHINDKHAMLNIVHVDIVVESIIKTFKDCVEGFNLIPIKNVFQITVGDLADHIRSFYNSRTSLTTEKVGDGIIRSLYSTYISYLTPKNFLYSIPFYKDDRGIFVEMLKTKDSGQFSFFTAKPGVTRGRHYHHTKTEKFLVIKGEAKFNFRHILSNDSYIIKTTGDKPQIVETVPGWAHDISNTGNDELVVMLWANEIFDRDKPDTIPSEVKVEEN